MKLVEEMVKSIQDLNSLSSSDFKSNVKDEGNNLQNKEESITSGGSAEEAAALIKGDLNKNGEVSPGHSGDSADTISINKNILPYFSIPVILKKISDQKKNENLNLLNPQKKLVYKIIKSNTKLVEFTTNIKKYNFNLNSFKGNNLDFILFIKNNLYYNLKYRLSNISYKIEKFVPVFKLYSLLNNINLFSPKRLLKPQPYIRFSYRLRYITKITKPILSIENMASLNENKKMKSGAYASSLTPSHQIMELNGRAINYLLTRLTNLGNEIEYLINIKNKFIKLIKFLKIINIESRLDGSLLTFNGKEENTNAFRWNANILKEESNLDNNKNICKVQTGIPVSGVTLGGASEVLEPALLSIQGQSFKGTGYDDLYLQITKGTDAGSAFALTENKIKIEKTIKLMCNSNESNLALESSPYKNTLDSRWDRYLISLENSVKSNPVDILYFNNNLNRPIINQYLKSMSMYNMITKGTMMFYSKFIGFNLFPLTPNTKYPELSISYNGSAQLKRVNKSCVEEVRDSSIYGGGLSSVGLMQTNKLIKNIYKFLYSSFRSMYCLISKPVFIFKANKIIIQLFYFILIPKILKYKKKKKFNYLKKKNLRILQKDKGKIKDIFNNKEEQTSESHYEGAGARIEEISLKQRLLQSSTGPSGAFSPKGERVKKNQYV
jgi:hypothetical protein